MIDLSKYAEKLEELTDKELEALEKEILKLYDELMKSSINRLSDVFSKYEVDGQLNYSEMARYNRLESFMLSLEEQISHSQKLYKSILFTALGNILFDSYLHQSWSLGIEVNEEVIPAKKLSLKEQMLKVAISNPVSGLTLNEILERHRREIIWSVRQETSRSIVRGSTYKDMVNTLTSVLEGDRNKAIRIARTESHRARETGSLEYAKQLDGNGIKTKKKWVTMKDSRVRKSRKANHQKMNGVIVDIDEQFDLGGGKKTMAPGNSGYAEHDINCRCLLVYQVDYECQETQSNDNSSEIDVDFNVYKKFVSAQHKSS